MLVCVRACVALRTKWTIENKAGRPGQSKGLCKRYSAGVHSSKEREKKEEEERIRKALEMRERSSHMRFMSSFHRDAAGERPEQKKRFLFLPPFLFPFFVVVCVLRKLRYEGDVACIYPMPPLYLYILPALAI